MKHLIATAMLFSFATLSYAQNPSDELKARFVGRTGGATEDRRVDEHDLGSFLGPGPKTGCHGDTLSAGVTITKADVSIQGNTATINATYSGKYTRQGWITPCVQSPPPNGHEDRNVSGTISFAIKQIPFKNVEVTWGGTGNFGEVSSPDHDSNIFAVQAAKNAIQSGL